MAASIDGRLRPDSIWLYMDGFMLAAAQNSFC